jgi:hypothetical protein
MNAVGQLKESEMTLQVKTKEGGKKPIIGENPWH